MHFIIGNLDKTLKMNPCSICLKTPNSHKAVLVVHQSGDIHEFCKKHLYKWTEKNRGCPLCRDEKYAVFPSTMFFLAFRSKIYLKSFPLDHSLNIHKIQKDEDTAQQIKSWDGF